MQLLVLKIFYQGRLFKVCPFTDDQISLGSGKGLSLRLDGIAPWHIVIEKKWDRYTIFDLGSETGTFINGQRIAGEYTLQSGTSFQIGPYQIQFFVGPPPKDFPPPFVSSTKPPHPSSGPSKPPTVPKEEITKTQTQFESPPVDPSKSPSLLKEEITKTQTQFESSPVGPSEPPTVPKRRDNKDADTI